MTTWWDRRPEAQRAVGRMGVLTIVLVALTAASGLDGDSGLAVTAVFMFGAIGWAAWQQVQLRRPASRMSQRLLFAEAFSTMRIPPEADRVLWRRWLEPTPEPPDDRWSMIETVYLGLLAGVLIPIQYSLAPWWGAVVAVGVILLLILVSRWTGRRREPSPWQDSDRAYLLDQLDALERRRDP